MGLFSKIFKSKPTTEELGWRVGGTEDFMTLIRVYYQAVMAANFGMRDLRALPDLRIFKQTLKIPTVNNRIGIGEKNKCKKMLTEIYGLPDTFYTEIDNSIRKRCKSIQDMQTYLFQFQGFSQELMMLMGNLMKWKFRIPAFMKGALRSMTSKTINEIMTKNDWKDIETRKAVNSLRAYQHTLGYSEKWMTDFVYNIIILAKKDPKPDATAND